MFEHIPDVVVQIIADLVISNRRRRQTDERFFNINGTASPSVPDILSAGGSAQPALPPVFLSLPPAMHAGIPASGRRYFRTWRVTLTLHLSCQIVEIEDIAFFAKQSQFSASTFPPVAPRRYDGSRVASAHGMKSTGHLASRSDA